MPRYATMPKSLQAPTESTSLAKIEYALATVTSDAEALDPLTLEEAKSRSDWPRCDVAIKIELDKNLGNSRTTQEPQYH